MSETIIPPADDPASSEGASPTHVKDSSALAPGSGGPDGHRAVLENLAFVASSAPDAVAARARLARRYGNAPQDQADVIIALGGDGLMLQTLHANMRRDIPIYGMNRGSVGFLMNDYNEDDLLDRLASAHVSTIHPLSMTVQDREGTETSALAINEVSLFRQTHQAAKLRITIDGKERMAELVCDGALVSTPAGSTAYNLSAHGPILPINAPLLALTPISPFRPRRWRGAILPDHGHIRFDVLEEGKRPVSAVADHAETRFVKRVDIQMDRTVDLTMMFDADRALDERILTEQFLY
ncbi:MAG: NAD kinase [Pseudomonadota bacterium]